VSFETGLSLIMCGGGLLVALLLAAVVAKVKQRGEGARHAG
jgi:hypothetical protein